jgi:hypothetical protein
MQHDPNPTVDAALDAALAADVRRIELQVLFDWNGDALFTNAWSDLSGALTQVDGTKEWTTSLPQDVAGITGFSTGQVTLSFAGTRNDSDLFTVYQLLSEYNSASPLYQFPRENVRVILNAIVTTSLGPIAVRLMTGQTYSVIPQRSNETVTVTVRDKTGGLRRAITLPRWATDGDIRQAHQSLGSGNVQNSVNGFLPTTSDMTFDASGIVDLILRVNGVFQSPPPVDDTGIGTSLLSVPFSGTHLPDIGFGFFDYSVDINIGDLQSLLNPDPDFWGPAKFGIGYQGNSAVVMSGPNYQCNQVFSPASPPSAGKTVAISFFIKPDGTIGPNQFGSSPPVNESGVDLFFTPLTLLGPVANDFMSLVVLTDGTTSMTLSGESGYSHSVAGPTMSLNAWHFIGLAVTFQPTQVVVTFCLDGTQTTTTIPGAYPNPIIPYNGGPYQGSGVLGLNNQAGCAFYSSFQCVQIFTYTGVPTGAANWPMTIPAGAQTSVLDRSFNKLSTVPDILNADSWSTLTDIASAEFAVLWADELGVFRFMNRDTLRAFLSRPPDQVLTLDKLQELQISSAVDGVRNFITWTSTSSAQFLQAVWTAPTTGFMTSATGTSFQIPITVEDASYISTIVEMFPFTSQPDPGIWSTFIQGIYAVSTATNAQVNPTSGTAPITGFGGVFWEVGSDPNGRFGTISISNISGNTVGFFIPGSSGDGTPSFTLAGEMILQDAPATGVVENAASIARYGFQPFALPASSWTQDADSAQRIALSLMREMHVPLPIAQSPITVPGDPRRQLGDRFELQDPLQSGSRILCNATGIHFTWPPKTGYTDNLTIQVAAAPGRWILGDAQFSELAVTTVLT